MAVSAVRLRLEGRIRLFSTFGAVSSVALADRDGAAA
jgi:hypothetical protein